MDVTMVQRLALVTTHAPDLPTALEAVVAAMRFARTPGVRAVARRLPLDVAVVMLFDLGIKYTVDGGWPLLDVTVDTLRLARAAQMEALSGPTQH